MTVYKPVAKLARGAAELAVKLAQGRPVIAPHSVDNGKTQVPSVFFEVTTVTAANLRETVIADGFHPSAAIYGDD